MAQESVKVAIKGSSPLLMHQYPMVPIEAIEKKSPADQAEIAAYRTPEGKLYIPGVAVQRALINGASYSKGKGRGSLVKVVAACVMVNPEHLILDNQKYVVDARPVVVPATKGRVVRFRPKFETWKVEFTIEWDPTLLTETQIRRVVDDTGSRVGLLDFRPEKRGPFGRFTVVAWK